jgi:hypothetical protein
VAGGKSLLFYNEREGLRFCQDFVGNFIKQHYFVVSLLCCGRFLMMNETKSSTAFAV